MNISCNVARDLLPLYHDGVCSAESRVLVEAHLKECPDCAAIRNELRVEIEMKHGEPDDASALTKIGETVKRRSKRAWLGGMAAVLAVVLLLSGLNFLQDRKYQSRFAPFFGDVEPIRVDGAVETTERFEAMYDWVHGNYRFQVNVPRPGCQGVIEVTEYHWSKDILMQDLTRLTLNIRFANEGSYLYDISIEAPDGDGNWSVETLTIDQHGQTVDDASWDAKTRARKNQTLETYRSRILNILMAVEREWPFLTAE